MSGWRPALRIARRSIRRNLGRSLLVAVLVGLPVAAATMVDVVARTLFSAERDASRAMGAADAQVDGDRRVDACPTTSRRAGAASAPASAERDPEDVDLAALLPPGSRVARQPPRYFVGLKRGRARHPGAARARGPARAAAPARGAASRRAARPPSPTRC